MGVLVLHVMADVLSKHGDNQTGSSILPVPLLPDPARTLAQNTPPELFPEAGTSMGFRGGILETSTKTTDARAPRPSDLLLRFPPVDVAAALLKGECVGSFVTWCF